jgi:hypothetical protein
VEASADGHDVEFSQGRAVMQLSRVSSRSKESIDGVTTKDGKTPCLILLTVFALLLPAAAHTGDQIDKKDHGALVPRQYGEIVYQENPGRSNHIFIIAQSHRSLASGVNGVDTEQVQAEIYRLGEWLIRNEQVEILLPEGYFCETNAKPSVRAGPSRGPDLRGEGLDDETLAARLADTTTFVNADYLLHCTYNIRLQQIEDKRLYLAVADLIRSDSSCVSRQEEAAIHTALNYQQQKRSAVILENIPAVLDREYDHGLIKAKRAMVTVGLAHLREMIDFIKSGGARLIPPYGFSDSLPCHSGDLSRLREQYGITVILPRTLADNADTLRLTKLL